jgi:hypothetical protein
MSDPAVLLRQVSVSEFKEAMTLIINVEGTSTLSVTFVLG